MVGAKPYAQLHYREVSGNRMAYVDEGDGDAIVFAHGNPTSSYLWRNVMPHLEGQGRLVAADLIGMGGSDKLHPSGPDRYNYAEQRDYLFALWDALDLGDNVTLVLHDWGSVLGFDWANQHRDRIRGIAFMEASVTPISWSEFPRISAACLGAFDRRRARPWCWSTTSSSNKFCPQERCANSATKKWTTTGGRSSTRVSPGGRRCPGHATSQSTASPPTSHRWSTTTAAGRPKAMCPNCSSTPSQGHRRGPHPRPHPLMAEPHRDHHHRTALRPGGQPRRNRHRRRAIRTQAALTAGSPLLAKALNAHMTRVSSPLQV